MLVLWIALQACTPVITDSGGPAPGTGSCEGEACNQWDADTAVDTGAAPPPALPATITWGDVTIALQTAPGLIVQVTDTTDTVYQFGVAETDGGQDNWLGEDCIEGNEGRMGRDYELDFNTCRTTDNESGVPMLQLMTTYSPSQYKSAPENYTLMHSLMAADNSLSFLLIASTTGTCWAWGHNPSHYASFDCLYPE